MYEPGLDDVVRECAAETCFYLHGCRPGDRDADIIFVSVNTPTKTYGVGAGRAGGSALSRAVRATHRARWPKGDKIIVEKSAHPVRTAESLKRVLHSNSNGHRFEVLSNPEFLAEGTAVSDLEHRIAC